MLPTLSREMVLELRPEKNVLSSKSWCTFFAPFNNEKNVFGHVSLFFLTPRKLRSKLVAHLFGKL